MYKMEIAFLFKHYARINNAFVYFKIIMYSFILKLTLHIIASNDMHKTKY